MTAPITTEELRNLVDDVTLDRDIGTEDHWWHSQVSDFYLDEDFGAYDDQKASDKRRILRLPEIDRAAVALAAELITAREKLEAAAKMAEAIMGMDDGWRGISDKARAALAAWEASQ